MYNLRTITNKRSYMDRRGDQDRRQHYDIQVVEKMGYDRRKPGFERRTKPEQRTGWVRVSDWSSACVECLS
ncbi:MAG: hypothetical protein KKE61_07765 [Proteobacteria bacterium]|nr:hypothetical protein [Pseudomonadota bacterium]